MSQFAPSSAFLLLLAASSARAEVGVAPVSLTLRIPNHKSDQPVSRIIDGESAKRGQYPFYAAYEVKIHGHTRTFCGSSLIAKQFALTAAHCNLANSDSSMKDEPFTVRVSAYELEHVDSATEEVRLLTKIIDHPKYELISSGSGTHAVFDYGVLKWETPVTTVKPIEIFNADTFAANDVSDKLTVIGLGLTSCTQDTRPEVLQEVEINFVEDVQCGEDYLLNGLGDIIDPSNMICAGGPGIKGSWQGDSGGPLFFTADGEQKQIGVVSFGVCGAGIPGVYARMNEAAIKFVESEMKKEAGI